MNYLDKDFKLIEEKSVDTIKRSIERAVKNGYKFPFSKDFLFSDEMLFGHTWWAAVIFSKDFARGFWAGHDKVDTGYYYDAGDTQEKLYQDAWAYHLQSMVLFDNPIEYLEKCLLEE